MAKQTTASKHLRPLLILILSMLVFAGCGGKGQLTASNGGTPSANSSPSPTPSPTPNQPPPGTGSLAATPTTLAFGSLALNTTSSQTVKVTNSGTGPLTVTQDTISGSEFSTGLTTPLTLNAGQSLNVAVAFTPTVAGTQNGSLTLASNGSTVLTVPLSGTGVTPVAHSVDISWTASTTSPLQGYNVYRSPVSGGPYAKISPALSSTTLIFTDTSVVSGQKYFYVVTALDTSGVESVASNEVPVTVPVP
ncbi:MAG TPA: choice-of-anchor D domain-containing protein [Candidatus Limnocylindrales bacterium]|nr:choice-of-anchor D domain-containing protein [Candidatus Limnocylindrales bacterium]